MGKAIARHFDVDLPLILTEGLSYPTWGYIKQEPYVYRVFSSAIAMTPTKILVLTSTPLGLLTVYTDGGCWQFRVLSPSGAVFGLQKLYYSAEAAEREGREWVGAGW